MSTYQLNKITKKIVQSAETARFINRQNMQTL